LIDDDDKNNSKEKNYFILLRAGESSRKINLLLSHSIYLSREVKQEERKIVYGD
jgi:hypothetical protein